MNPNCIGKNTFVTRKKRINVADIISILIFVIYLPEVYLIAKQRKKVRKPKKEYCKIVLSDFVLHPAGSIVMEVGLSSNQSQQ
jgi:uncharacterized protein YpmB